MTASTTHRWLASSKRNPCPICGRTKDGDCRITADGQAVICHYGQTHHPPEGLTRSQVITGHDGQSWAFTGKTEDNRAATFTIDKPREAGITPRSITPRKVVPLRPAASPPPAPINGPVVVARLPQQLIPSPPPDHLPDGHRLDYSPTQWTQIKDHGERPRHLAGGEVTYSAGPDPWPLYGHHLLEHATGQWIAAAEGPKCATWLQAGGLVAVSQPGHDHKADSIARRFRDLQAAGIAGMLYLADHDATGQRKAEQLAAGAAAVGLPFIAVAAAEVWPDLPQGGSIDDAPGTAADRVEALLTFIPQQLERLEHEAARGSAAPGRGNRKAIEARRLGPAEVRDRLPQELGPIRLNSRTGQIEAGGRVLAGDALSHLYLELSTDAEIWDRGVTADAASFHAYRNPYDPVTDWLEGIEAEPLPLDQWQELERHVLGITDPLGGTILRRFLIGAVARVMEPGCWWRVAPVLLGEQEKGKTELIRALLPDQDWFVSGVGKLDRDAVQRIGRAWLVELGELDGITRKADQEHLKAFLTERVDTYRAPYARTDQSHPRRCVFIGTANHSPLRDSTGSTRFAVIQTGSQPLPVDWVKEHRAAIWARALAEYRAGTPWSHTKEERDAIAERNADHTSHDPWREEIEEKIGHRAQLPETLPIKAAEAYSWLGLELSKQTNQTAERLDRIFSSLGWQKARRRRPGGEKALGWWPPAPPAAGHPGQGGVPGGVPGQSDCAAMDLNPPGTPGTPIQEKKVSEGEGERERPPSPPPVAADPPESPPELFFRPLGVPGVPGTLRSTAPQGISPGTPGGAQGVPGGVPGPQEGDSVAVLIGEPMAWVPGWRVAYIEHDRARVECGAEFRVLTLDRIRMG